VEAITPRTRAILAVHTFVPAGRNAQIAIHRAASQFIFDRRRLRSLGAEYRGKKIGAFGDVAVFAFYPTNRLRPRKAAWS